MAFSCHEKAINTLLMSLESKGCPGERRNAAHPGACSGTLPGGSQWAKPLQVSTSAAVSCGRERLSPVAYLIILT